METNPGGKKKGTKDQTDRVLAEWGDAALHSVGLSGVRNPMGSLA